MRQSKWSHVLREFRQALGRSSTHLANGQEAVAARVSSIEDQLRAVYDLFESGEITEQEFQLRKKAILSQL